MGGLEGIWGISLLAKRASVKNELAKINEAYSQAEKNALAESDDPHAMIVVLFDELLRRMRSFVSNLDGDENAIKVRNESTRVL